MSNSEKLIQLIMSDGLPYLFSPTTNFNRNNTEIALSLAMQELSLEVDDFKDLDQYIQEVVSALDGYWGVLTDQGYGVYIYRDPNVNMESLARSQFFNKYAYGRMAISDKAHRKLGELLSNTEMVLRLEEIGNRLLLSTYGFQVKVKRHTSDDGYITLSIMMEFDDWDQTALFRCLFGQAHPLRIRE